MTSRQRAVFSAFFFLSLSSVCLSRPIQTNAVLFQNPPKWLKKNHLRRTTRRIENRLEWDIRRIRVQYYQTEAQFDSAHQLGMGTVAFARRGDQSIHLGPRVTLKNFSSVFGHELAHIVVYQKYKDAIPRWLNEGLANWAAQKTPPNFDWLKKQKIPNLMTISHLYRGEDKRIHYATSHAMIHFIKQKCGGLNELLQLATGKKLETFLRTYCEIRNVHSEFEGWLKRK